MAKMLLKPPSCGVFFGNLHSKVTDKHLLELGTQAGPVHRASKSKDSAFGFVEYADVESAIYCVGLYHGLLRLFGQSVIVNFSNSPAGQLTPQEQALLDRCIKAIDTTAASSSSNAANSQHAGAGAVRRGGRDTQRYTPYGDARGHREQRAATRAPSRFNDDEDAEYGAFGGSDGYGWPGRAAPAAAAAAQPPRPLGAGAVAAMQAAAAAAAAAAAGLSQSSLPPMQQQAGGWQVAPPAHVPVQHVNPQAVHVVIQQQQQPPQQLQQPAQVYQLVQQAAPPAYAQPQQQYQQYQVVDPAAAAYQQWHQQHQQHHHHQQQQQYPTQHVQFGAPGAGGFQTSMPPGLPGQQQQQQQQQQQAWYQ